MTANQFSPEFLSEPHQPHPWFKGFIAAALAGHPQTRLRFIHVARTNGKGPTCATFFEFDSTNDLT